MKRIALLTFLLSLLVIGLNGQMIEVVGKAKITGNGHGDGHHSQCGQTI